MLSRRKVLLGGLTASALLFPGAGFVKSLAIARSPGERRFVFIIQRGAADGMSIVAPVGDPAYAKLRGRLAAGSAGGLKLDSLFTLHPKLSRVGELFKTRQALFVHATASPYRARSHFDGQNVLETGGTGPYVLKTGWLHRFCNIFPGGDERELAMSNAVPAVLRGGEGVLTVGPDKLPPTSQDLLAAVSAMYEADPVLHPVWDQALASRELLDEVDEPGAARKLGQTAGELLGENEPGRIAVIETGGWDTHAQQLPRLSLQLGKLDQTIAGLEAGLGPVWNQTVVLVASEFGRTAAENGTFGTDHGTANVAMLLGGGISGGRVAGEWPGLAPSDLYENRDLRATTDLFSLIASVLGEHFALDTERVAKVLFPDTGARPLQTTFV